MQAYQSPPCPYCGVTWNQPGAQACANCRNPLPPPQPSYAPPGYPQGQQPGLGQVAVLATSEGDVPLVMGLVVDIGVIVILVNLIIDLLQGFLNPKARIS